MSFKCSAGSSYQKFKKATLTKLAIFQPIFLFLIFKFLWINCGATHDGERIPAGCGHGEAVPSELQGWNSKRREAKVDKKYNIEVHFSPFKANGVILTRIN